MTIDEAIKNLEALSRRIFMDWAMRQNFEETKTKMEALGFKFEPTIGETEGVWVYPPPGYIYPAIFIAGAAPSRISYLETILNTYDKRGENDY